MGNLFAPASPPLILPHSWGVRNDGQRPAESHSVAFRVTNARSHAEGLGTMRSMVEGARTPSAAPAVDKTAAAWRVRQRSSVPVQPLSCVLAKKVHALCPRPFRPLLFLRPASSFGDADHHGDLREGAGASGGSLTWRAARGGSARSFPRALCPARPGALSGDRPFDGQRRQAPQAREAFSGTRNGGEPPGAGEEEAGLSL